MSRETKVQMLLLLFCPVSVSSAFPPSFHPCLLSLLPHFPSPSLLSPSFISSFIPHAHLCSISSILTVHCLCIREVLFPLSQNTKPHLHPLPSWWSKGTSGNWDLGLTNPSLLKYSYSFLPILARLIPFSFFSTVRYRKHPCLTESLTQWEPLLWFHPLS